MGHANIIGANLGFLSKEEGGSQKLDIKLFRPCVRTMLGRHIPLDNAAFGSNAVLRTGGGGKKNLQDCRMVTELVSFFLLVQFQML